MGCSPWGRYKSDMTERCHFHFSLSCIGGGNGNPLQCSCLENPRDRGAWWAAVWGRTESDTTEATAAAATVVHRIHVPSSLSFSLVGHLGCFHILAIANAAVNLRTCVSF